MVHKIDTGKSYDEDDPAIVEVFTDGNFIFTTHIDSQADASSRATDDYADEAALILCEYDQPPAGWELLGHRNEGDDLGVSVYRNETGR